MASDPKLTDAERALTNRVREHIKDGCDGCLDALHAFLAERAAPAEPGGAGHGVGSGGVEDTIHKLHAPTSRASEVPAEKVQVEGEVPVENRDSGPLPLRCNQLDIRGEECELPRGHADSFDHRGISKDEMTAMVADAQIEADRLRARVEKLEAELKVDEALLDERNRLLALFNCVAHGSGCVPDAMEQVVAMRERVEKLEGALRTIAEEYHQKWYANVKHPFTACMATPFREAAALLAGEGKDA